MYGTCHDTPLQVFHDPILTPTCPLLPWFMKAAGCLSIFKRLPTIIGPTLASNTSMILSDPTLPKSYRAIRPLLVLDLKAETPHLTRHA